MEVAHLFLLAIWPCWPESEYLMHLNKIDKTYLKKYIWIGYYEHRLLNIIGQFYAQYSQMAACNRNKDGMMWKKQITLQVYTLRKR